MRPLVLGWRPKSSHLTGEAPNVRDHVRICFQSDWNGSVVHVVLVEAGHKLVVVAAAAAAAQHGSAGTVDGSIAQTNSGCRKIGRNLRCVGVHIDDEIDVEHTEGAGRSRGS